METVWRERETMEYDLFSLRGRERGFFHECSKMYKNVLNNLHFSAKVIFVSFHLLLQDAAADLPDDIAFPTVQQMGEQVISTVLDQLDFTSRNCIIGIGEGAGSNILVRFALGHTSRVLGLILIHLVTAGVGMLEKLKDTFISGKRRPSEAFQSPDQVIAMHRLGMTAAAAAAASSTSAGSPASPTANTELTAATAILSDSYQRRVASLNRKLFFLACNCSIHISPSCSCLSV